MPEARHSRSAMRHRIVRRLLGSGQDRIERGIGFGVDGGELAFERSDTRSKLIDRSRAVGFDRGGKRATVGLNIGKDALRRRVGIGENCGCLGLLRIAQAEKTHQVAHAHLNHGCGVGWRARCAEAARVWALRKNESSRERGRRQKPR